MKGATLSQAVKILDLFKDAPAEQVQDILASGFLADLRDADVARIDRGEFRKMCGLRPLHLALSVWRTITIGGKSKEDLLAEMESADIDLHDAVPEVMSNDSFTTLPESRTISLARISVKDLGFRRKVSLGRALIRISEIGDLCPAEVGPHLRLALKNQPAGDLFVVAMKPATDERGCPYLFNLQQSCGLSVLGLSYGMDFPCDLDKEFVFVLRK